MLVYQRVNTHNLTKVEVVWHKTSLSQNLYHSQIFHDLADEPLHLLDFVGLSLGLSRHFNPIEG